MASPSLDLLCCSFRVDDNASHINPNDSSPTISPKYFYNMRMYFILYNSTVIIMSALSVIGALYVLYPKPRRTLGIQSVAGKVERRQKWILFWLSFADIMACLGELNHFVASWLNLCF